MSRLNINLTIDAKALIPINLRQEMDKQREILHLSSGDYINPNYLMRDIDDKRIQYPLFKSIRAVDTDNSESSSDEFEIETMAEQPSSAVPLEMHMNENEENPEQSGEHINHRRIMLFARDIHAYDIADDSSDGTIDFNDFEGDEIEGAEENDILVDQEEEMQEEVPANIYSKTQSAG